ncbi:succinate dehydrogenase, cytochrome b556 subunit [Teredinibacter waterburyi]|uniref:succinate dehydrogenase, cytochrome b556 subunit n=1 Tax=Teredinibacter waterburyi TaxID=1500538 RepID=UPI00165F566C|nr:succinate dehydrogenase, cytochrome b556 subunit [Teredinibacter waterburyi]
MKDKRPVNLDLSTVKFPITAIASITHRVSGVILLAGVLLLLVMLDMSLSSEDSFAELQQLMSAVWAKLIVWAVLSALAYHLAAGVRHLIMDLGFGESLEGGRLGAKLMFAVALLMIAGLGVWLW